MRRLVALAIGFFLLGPLLVTSPASAETTQAPKVSLKLRFGRCQSACTVYVTVKNRSQYVINRATGRCTLRVNGRVVGKGAIAMGSIKRGRSRTTTCRITDKRLRKAWQNYSNGYADFNTKVSAKVTYRYYYWR